MQLDREIFLWIQSFTGNPALDQAMVLFAEYLVFLVPLSLIYLWFENKEESLFAFYTALTGLALSYMVGLLYGHSNPSAFFDTIAAFKPENSFPSQHTTIILATALPILYREKEPLGLTLLLSGLLTGFARIYIGEHWPVDILGAVFAASLALLICSSTWQHLEKLWRPLIRVSNKVEKEIHERIDSNL